MKRVYIADSLADAYLVCNRLLESGINAQVFNEYSNGAVGELPFTHTWPEVWVENDRHVAFARQIVEHRELFDANLNDVQCPQCGEANPVNFEVCWNCSADL